MKANKTEQLQIRVSPQEKAQIKRIAKAANLSMSDWVITKLLPDHQQRFHQLVIALNNSEPVSFTLAALNNFLAQLTSDEFRSAVCEKPRLPDDEYLKNYIAAMIEYTANNNTVNAPDWVQDIQPLNKPSFGSNLKSLRLYLLTHSPPPFRSRNIFIDSTVGDCL